ncbi:MAG TPA: YgiQ family radical SAM protein, partial [Planctomycetota bacterium]|nr:YgiQ family radical SAM protein [Planctomycetota bacterium]
MRPSSSKSSVDARDADRRGFLPAAPEDVEARGWDAVDVVFVTGDAYVDHPSFAMAILGRVLEARGFRVAILSQPDWRSVESFRAFGRPRLFFAVSAGNMDSMINHYTANRKPRSDDAYSPGGAAGRRPDRATNVYAQRCREAFPGVPVIAGGVEASLRRFAHYDYWSDAVRPSILLSSKADLCVYGMGEEGVVEIAERLLAGAAIRDLRDLRGAAYLLGKSESIPDFPAAMRAAGTPPDDTRELPSFEEVAADKVAFAKATAAIHKESNPFNARRLVQRHGDRTLVQNPPRLPLDVAAMDRIYDLPYKRRAHPMYAAPVPAEEMMRTSVTIMRGCFGGCTFCSITTHQGRIIQSRSEASVLREVAAIADGGKGAATISDLGGPTANMYRMRCTRPEVEEKCRRLSCVHPTICKLLGADHAPVVALMRAARATPGVRKVNIASGVRMDLARRSPEYLDELVRHHVGGHLKVAPEHVSDGVLKLMKKPGVDDFAAFETAFEEASARAGKSQYLVPYFIASHPGSTLADMIELAVYLKRNGYRPQQVQDFIPSPMDLATAMYWTGLDPETLKPVPVARNLRDRRMQRALMQFFKPENWFECRRALEEAGRTDLIGEGCDALIPSRPPKEALEARRSRAGREFGRYVHERGLRPEDRAEAGAGPTAPRSDWDAFTGYRDREQTLPDDDAPSPASAKPAAPARPRSTG